MKLRRNKGFVALFVCFGLLLFASSYVYAQIVDDFQTTHKLLDTKQQELDDVEKILNKEEVSGQELASKRQSIKDILDATIKISIEIKPLYENALDDIKDLGPVPVFAEGEVVVPEPENIQAQRKQLQERSLELEGLLRQADALSSKSVRLLERLSAFRRDLFLHKILEKQASPFSGELWRYVREALNAELNKSSLDKKDEKKADPEKSAEEETSSYLLIASLLVLFGVLLAFRHFSILSLKRRVEKGPEKFSGSFFTFASSSSLISMIVSSIALFVVHQIFEDQGVIHDSNLVFSTHVFLLAAYLLFVIIVAGRMAAVGVIRSGIKWIACFAALLYVIDGSLLEYARQMESAVEIAVLQTYIFTSLFALLVIFGSLLAFRKSEKSGKNYMPRRTFLFFLAFGFFILIANILGYAALSRFIFERLNLLVSLLTLLLMLRAIGRNYLRQIDDLFHKRDLEKDKEKLFFFWLALTLDALLIFISLPITANLVGAEWSEIEDWAIHAFWGFSIGNVDISLANIFIGLGIFLFLLFATRFLQNILGEKILPKTRMDSSIRQSLVQVLGYCGLAIAMMAGVSALGFDLSNLALIAGALSLGIGFGLQSIVSNFVSGLILLFERPIKVGDWVILSSGQGIVKKISVRATEIETFDRMSIIVPNSELISASVKNWTYNDRIGRIIIPISVSYKSNPRRVREILIACAKDHPSVLSHPAPGVYFKDFGDSALLFELRVFLRNIRDNLDVETDLRLMIWDKFSEEGIDIPFPQRVVHVEEHAVPLKAAYHAD